MLKDAGGEISADMEKYIKFIQKKIPFAVYSQLQSYPWWRIFHEMIENHRLWLLIFFHNRIRLVFVDGENGFPLSTLSFSVDWSVWAKSIKMLLQFIKSILSTLIRPPVGTCRSKPTIICWVLIDNLLEINHREPFCMRINQTLRLHDGWRTTNSSNNPSKIRAHLPEKK